MSPEVGVFVAQRCGADAPAFLPRYRLCIVDLFVHHFKFFRVLQWCVAETEANVLLTLPLSEQL